MTHTPSQTLDEVRTAIDALDGELIALLAKRQALVEQAGRLKPKKRRRCPNPERVAKVIADRQHRASQVGLA